MSDVVLQVEKPRVVVFASGDEEGGGSGFEMLVDFSRTSPAVLNAEIVGVVSNHAHGGVYEKAKRLGVPFHHFTPPYSEERYRGIIQLFGGRWVMLSGWLLFVRGLETSRTINIHPGPLPDFGGAGMHGHHVHQAVLEAYRAGKIKQSAVSMHFVDSKYKYDTGPVFFELPVLIRPDDTPDSLAVRVNKMEHAWQAYALNLVVHGAVYLDETQNSWIVRSPVGVVVPGMSGKRITVFSKPLP